MKTRNIQVTLGSWFCIAIAMIGIMAPSRTQASFITQSVYPAFGPTIPTVGPGDAVVTYFYQFQGTPSLLVSPCSWVEFALEESTYEVTERFSTNGYSSTKTERNYFFYSTSHIEPGNNYSGKGTYRGDNKTGTFVGTNIIVSSGSSGTTTSINNDIYWYAAHFLTHPAGLGVTGLALGDPSDMIYSNVTTIPGGTLTIIRGNWINNAQACSIGGLGYAAVGNGIQYQIQIELHPSNSVPTVVPPQTVTYAMGANSNSPTTFANLINLSTNGNSFQFNLVGATNATYTVSASTNLVNWVNVSTNTLSGTNVTYTDTNAAAYPARFYRFASGTNQSGAYGYVKRTVGPGVNFIANQLLNAAGAAASVLITNVPNGTQLFKYNSAFQAYDSTNVYSTSTGWSIPDMSLLPGEGAVMVNPTTNAFDLHFVGQVPDGQLELDIPLGYSFVSSLLPGASNLPALGYVPGLNDSIFTWNFGSQTLNDPYSWYDAATAGTAGWYDVYGNPVTPTIKTGESFLLNRSTGSSMLSWTNTFNVWP